MLNKEFKISFAGSQHLEELELKANEVLMKHKNAELSSGYHHPGYYPTLQNIPNFIKQVQTSKIFKILKAMPKAGLLHIHDTGMTSGDYIFNLTYRKNLYICCHAGGKVSLRFFNHPDTSCNWKLVKDKRADPFFDAHLREKLTSLKRIPARDSHDFGEMALELFDLVYDLVSYKPIFEDYVYEMLLEHYMDGIRYVEVRAACECLYDADGNIYDYDHIVQIYLKVLEEFKNDFPDFYSLRIIYSVDRRVSNEELEERLVIYENLKQKYGYFIAGLDLLGREDEGRTLKEFVPLLWPLKESASIQFFLHAGATNWYGGPSDENIVDALMLGSKRLGHATALSKHPKLMQMAKQKDIAIEVAPLSEHIVGRSVDARAHPAAVMAALGVNFVICNDMPGLWGVEAVSYDWYLAFMGFASARDDLRYLKKLALNSIEYSALDKQEKGELREIWTREWIYFIHRLANGELI
ncbi:adenosine deaminase 2-like [Atheta coriaria]|uniref:adenosine deaminase 2-like n=1 Tax=Dalotia coriaria TaxID=877792 RepID=UPI0031F3E413